MLCKLCCLFLSTITTVHALQCCVGQVTDPTHFNLCDIVRECAPDQKCFAITGVNPASQRVVYVQNCTQKWSGKGRTIERKIIDSLDCVVYELNPDPTRKLTLSIWECACDRDFCNRLDSRKRFPNYIAPPYFPVPPSSMSTRTSTTTTTRTSTEGPTSNNNNQQQQEDATTTMCTTTSTTSAATATTTTTTTPQKAEPKSVAIVVLVGIVVVGIAALGGIWIWSCIDRAMNGQCACDKYKNNTTTRTTPVYDVHQSVVGGKPSMIHYTTPQLTTATTTYSSPIHNNNNNHNHNTYTMNSPQPPPHTVHSSTGSVSPIVDRLN